MIAHLFSFSISSDGALRIRAECRSGDQTADSGTATLASARVPGSSRRWTGSGMDAPRVGNVDSARRAAIALTVQFPRHGAWIEGTSPNTNAASRVEVVSQLPASGARSVIDFDGTVRLSVRLGGRTAEVSPNRNVGARRLSACRREREPSGMRRRTCRSSWRCRTGSRWRRGSQRDRGLRRGRPRRRPHRDRSRGSP